jgi:hypothetical protein
MMQGMTLDTVCKILAAECYAAGGQNDWAAAHGFSASFVSAVLTGRKQPSERMLAILRLERVVSYRRIRG